MGVYSTHIRLDHVSRLVLALFETRANLKSNHEPLDNHKVSSAVSPGHVIADLGHSPGHMIAISGPNPGHVSGPSTRVSDSLMSSSAVGCVPIRVSHRRRPPLRPAHMTRLPHAPSPFPSPRTPRPLGPRVKGAASRAATSARAPRPRTRRTGT